MLQQKIKIIKICTSVCVFLIAIYYILNGVKMVQQPITNINVAVLMDNFKLPIDPLENTTITNAFFVNHIYSNLVEVDNNNNFIADACSSFYWSGSNLYFEFENTIINAEDAYFNIMRTFYVLNNDHGNLQQLLCSANESIEDCAKKISVENNKLILQIENENIRKHVIPTLSSINYKIVPKSAFSTADYKNAKIKNYEITSGRYTLDIENKKLISKQKLDRPSINVVDANQSNIEQLITDKKIDVISTTIPITDQLSKFLKSHSWGLDITYPISIGFVYFSDLALKRTTISDRLLFGHLVSRELFKTPMHHATETAEFFQSFSSSNLDEKQIDEVKKIRNDLPNHIENRIFFGVGNVARWTEALKQHVNVKVIKNTKFPLDLDDNEMPDAFVLSNDLSFETSFSLFSYIVKKKIFKAPDHKDLITQFINFKTDIDRSKFISSVHYSNIENVKIYPIWSAPYVTAYRKGLKSNMSKFNSRTLMWEVTNE